MKVGDLVRVYPDQFPTRNAGQVGLIIYRLFNASKVLRGVEEVSAYGVQILGTLTPVDFLTWEVERYDV